MQQAYNYSIIIPHKNIPNLLVRCLNSIPERKDVQIIVVDDNSTDSDTYLSKYPELSRKNLELYLTKEGKGAGYARNVGLDHAKGKWVIFADADDFFSKDFSSILDKNIDSEEDILFFDYDCVMSDDITQRSERVTFVHISYFLDEQGTIDDSIRYVHVTPWAKIIRRKLVEDNEIRFQEIKWSNDVYFGTCTGVKAGSITASKEIMYILTERDNSLAVHKEKTLNELLVRTRAGLDSFKYAQGKGYSGTLSWTVELYRSNHPLQFIRALAEVDTKYLQVIYQNAIWGKTVMEKIELIALIALSRINIWKRITFNS